MSSGTMREPATRFGIAYISTLTNRLPSRYDSGDNRYTTTIGRSCSAHCTVAVPDAVITTSADAITSSVRSRINTAPDVAPPTSGANSAASIVGAQATVNWTSGTRA